MDAKDDAKKGVSDPPPPPMPPPVMPNPFRPEARPTYFSPSMRSPVFSSTAARPGAISIEAQYANQVPLERQGAVSLTDNELVYATADYGLRGALPLSYGARERVPSRLRQARGPVEDVWARYAEAPADYLLFDDNSPQTWAALPIHERARWILGFRMGSSPDPGTPPSLAPLDYLDFDGNTQDSWNQLPDIAKLRWIARLRVGGQPLPDPAAPAPALAPAPAPAPERLSNTAIQRPSPPARPWTSDPQKIAIVAGVGAVVVLGAFLLLRSRNERPSPPRGRAR